MKKILFTLVCLVGFNCLGFGQWEKMSTKTFNAIPNSVHLAYYKDTIIIGSFDLNKIQYYFSTDDGKKWSRIRMPKNILGPVGYIDGNSVCMNKYGIFIVRTESNSKTIVYHSTNLGQTWSDTSFLNTYYITSDIFNYDTLTYIRTGRDIYKYENGKWGIFFDRYNISKNRIAIDSLGSVIILDAITKKRLAKAKLPNIAYRSVESFAQDSIITCYFSNDSKGKVSVSKDFGLTWNISELPSYRTFYSKINMGFKEEKIYMKGNNDLFISENYGQTWQYFDDSISYYRDINYKERGDNIYYYYYFSDSAILAINKGNLFIQRNNKKWKYIDNSVLKSERIIRVNDSIYWTNNIYTFMVSMNRGLNWSYFPNLIENIESSSNASIYAFNNKLYNYQYSSTNYSIDFGKTWIKDTIFPPVNPIIVGDTIFFKEYTKPLKMFTKPYLVGKELPINGAIPNWSSTDFFNPRFAKYSDGYFFVPVEDNVKNSTVWYRYRMIDGKKDSIFSNFLQSNSFVVNKNKIWICNQDSDSLFFSKDYGNNWTKFKVPEYAQLTKTGVTIIPFDNYLVINSAYSKLGYNDDKELKHAIFVSADDGKSWFPYNKGILLTQYTTSFNWSKIDSFIFLNTGELWRLSLKDLKLKSITGSVYFDSNKNGIKDTNEKPVIGAEVTVSQSGGFTTTTELGNYSLVVDFAGTDTLKVNQESKRASSSPAFYVISQSDTAKNFGIYAPANDLKVNITAITPPRPGFKNTYQINYKNIGSATANGSVSMTYNVKQSFVEATTAPTSNTNQTLVWNYTNLQPNESRVINLTLKTAVDAPIRTAITHVATIDPLSIDTFKTDNVDSLVLTVVGSYDPNDKQVTFNNSKTAPAVIDNTTELTYTIRFQNTGNYPADFVKVTDTLSDKLDISTLRIIATSHKYDVSLKNKNVLTFDFNPIFLPDSTSNEKDSHGFIKFAIKPKKTLTKEEVIKNTGYIFFDYNPAIITNTVESANQKANSLFTPSVSEPLSIYPNPTTGLLTVKMDKHLGKEIAVSIYSIDGKLMISKHQTARSENTINGETLQEGLYILQIKVGEDVMMGKFFVKK